MTSARGARLAALETEKRLNSNKEQVLGQLELGQNQSMPYLNEVSNLYGGMQALGQQGVDQYGGLTLGTGDQIQQRLEGLGSFQFNRDQGLEAINRRRAAAGMLGSGNADTDAMRFASGLASNTLNQERAALNPYLNMYQTGIAGGAAARNNIAGSLTDYYNNRASVIDDNNKAIAGGFSKALIAGDQARAARNNMMMGLGSSALSMLGTAAGGAGGFTKLFS